MGDYLLVLVYVDDMILTGSKSSLISALTRHLQARFAVKDLGTLTFFLGVEVARCREGLLLSQHKYIVELLRRHHMDGAKSVSTPMATSPSLNISGSIDPSEYRSAIGGLQYLTILLGQISHLLLTSWLRLWLHPLLPTGWV